MLLQSLWQLGDFQDECMKLCHSHHYHIGDPCIVCAFFKICDANHQGEAVDPTELRIALSTYDRDRNDPIEGKVKDAFEFLVIILRSLHEAFYTGNHDIVPDDLYEGNWDCLDSECWVHRRFGMDCLDHVKCDARICRKESRHQKYTSLFLTLDASSLTKLPNLYNRESFVELFERAVMFGRLNCEYCNQRSIRISNKLLRTPKVFTTVISWPRDDESSENISKTWNILRNKVNLKKLYERIDDINVAHTSSFQWFAFLGIVNSPSAFSTMVTISNINSIKTPIVLGSLVLGLMLFPPAKQEAYYRRFCFMFATVPQTERAGS